MDTSHEFPSRFRPPHPAAIWTLRVLALVGLGVSSMLVFKSGGLPGCGAGSGCDEVLTSSYATWLGLPVAAASLVIYGVILIGTTLVHPERPEPNQRAGWMLLLGLSATASLAALWFIGVQLIELQTACAYCLTVHACSLALLGLVLWVGPFGRTRVSPDEPADPLMIGGRAVTLVLLAALLPTAALVAGQTLAPASTVAVKQLDPSDASISLDSPRDASLGAPDASGEAPDDSGDGGPIRLGGRPDFDTGPGRDRRISVLNGAVQLAPHGQPIIGSPDAPVILIKSFDYTCPHCRTMHGLLEQARQRYGEQLAILPLACPLDADCNPYYDQTDARHEHACELARLALRVWHHDRGRFAEIHDWIFSHEQPPTPQEAIDFAATLIPRDKALGRDPLIEQDIARRIRRGIDFQAIINVPLPGLVVGATIVAGRPQTAEELFEILERESALRPVGDGG